MNLKTYLLFIMGSSKDIEYQLEPFMKEEFFVSASQVMIIVFKSEDEISKIENALKVDRIFFLIDITDSYDKIKYDLKSNLFGTSFAQFLETSIPQKAKEFDEESEIDNLLDKIQESGYESLSDEEKKILNGEF